MEKKHYLKQTKILNFNSDLIQALVKKRFLNAQPLSKIIEEIYYFVKDEILFGYNKSDDISALEVLKDGIGQCNTKTSLLMALSRAIGCPCRAHFFTINKKVQKGIFPKHVYEKHINKELIHSWPEIYLNERWIALEGIILDKPYLEQIKKRFQGEKQFEGYGVSVKDLTNISVNWSGGDTFIQKESITKDEGLYPSPDEFYEKNGVNIRGVKKFVFNHFIRKMVNKRVKQIRKTGVAIAI